MGPFIAVILLTLAIAQDTDWPFGGGRESDRHAGHTFEYHSRHRLMVVRGSGYCYLIDAHPDVILAFRSKEQQDALEDDIISHINSHDISHVETPYEALTQFHDALEAAECSRSKIYDLEYVINSSLALATNEVNTTTSYVETTTIGMNTTTIFMNTTAIVMNTTTIGMSTNTIGMNTTIIDMNTTVIGMNTTKEGMDTTTLDTIID